MASPERVKLGGFWLTLVGISLGHGEKGVGFFIKILDFPDLKSENN